MTAKFISTVLKSASVIAVPLAMLAAAVPANAQRPGQRGHAERRSNVNQEVLARMERARAAVFGGHYKYKDKNHKNDHYKAKNKNYKNGYYRNGRGSRDYDNDRRDNDRYEHGRYDNRSYPNGYPQRGTVRYPSSVVIPGFPTVNIPNGRTGKTLPGMNQQIQQNNNRHRGN